MKRYRWFVFLILFSIVKSGSGACLTNNSAQAKVHVVSCTRTNFYEQDIGGADSGGEVRGFLLRVVPKSIDVVSHPHSQAGVSAWLIDYFQIGREVAVFVPEDQGRSCNFLLRKPDALIEPLGMCCDNPPLRGLCAVPRVVMPVKIY